MLLSGLLPAPSCSHFVTSCTGGTASATPGCLRRNDAAQLPADSVDARSCVNRLRSLSEAGIPLCRRSRRLEATSDDITAAAYIAAWRGLPLADPPFITVISKLYVSLPEASNAAMLVVGHEAAGVALLDNTSFAVTKAWELDGPPAMIDVIGTSFQQAFCCLRPCCRLCHLCACMRTRRPVSSLPYKRLRR